MPLDLRDAQTRFAGFVATLGRGPGRSRALTRAEAREALGLVLAGAADPHQVGAFLMLLRYRGEDADEIAGLVEAAREAAGLDGTGLHADLDWPSYGAGKTRGAPWFLLAALALAGAGVRVLMHGSNDFSAGVSVEAALAALGIPAAADAAAVGAQLAKENFAYWPLRLMAPGLDRLLQLRRLFGLRSPINSVARLLDPATASAGVDGVFHPPYIAVHLGVAERLGRPRLLVLKGGGGEAERSPAKPGIATLWDGQARSDITLSGAGLAARVPEAETASALAAIWRGERHDDRAVATVRATIALGLLALGRATTTAAADDMAGAIWADRRPMPPH